MPLYPDGSGPRTTSPSAFSTAYFDGGCIINDAGAVPTQLDLISNPVYESARTMLRGNLRAFKRWADSSHGTPLLKSYEEVGGKGILRFERHYTLAGGGESLALDMWDGIAPPLLPIASGKLLSGVAYRVTGSIVYMGETVTDDTFTAVAGHAAYTGGGDVHQVEGIITTAPRPRGSPTNGPCSSPRTATAPARRASSRMRPTGMRCRSCTTAAIS
jgi:hypothetical protein